MCVFNQILLLLKLFRLSPSSISHIGFFFIFALGLRSLCFHYFWLIFTFYSFAVVEKMNFGRLRRSNQHPTAFYSYLHLFLFFFPFCDSFRAFDPFLPLFFFFFLFFPSTSSNILLHFPRKFSTFHATHHYPRESERVLCPLNCSPSKNL